MPAEANDGLLSEHSRGMTQLSIAHRSQLVAHGLSERQLASAVDEGRLERIRRGWYAAPEAPADVVRAVRVGGALTSVSATRLSGIWTPPDAWLHVAVPRNASRLRSPDSANRPLSRLRDKVCIHALAEPGVLLDPVLSVAKMLAHATLPDRGGGDHCDRLRSQSGARDGARAAYRVLNPSAAVPQSVGEGRPAEPIRHRIPCAGAPQTPGNPSDRPSEDLRGRTRGPARRRTIRDRV
ncbi:protein of unknown function [Agreia sp. COWG]|nr:protein of unknown function [Agreia sp. COWG]